MPSLYIGIAPEMRKPAQRAEKPEKPDKAAKLKTQAEREAELAPALAKLKELGVTSEIEGVAEFLKIADDFVTHGAAASGAIPMRGHQRKFVYLLSNKRHIQSTVVLSYDPNV